MSSVLLLRLKPLEDQEHEKAAIYICAECIIVTRSYFHSTINVAAQYNPLSR